MTPPIREDDKRGKTAAQMRDAPLGALYVIHNLRSLRWFEGLRDAIGRPDLRFMLAVSLTKPKNIVGLDVPAVVVDHWCAGVLTDEQTKGLHELRDRIAAVSNV